ncbi:MAG: Rpn family recombination-promoting nuclease/putative transposase [Polaribacter sp.]
MSQHKAKYINPLTDFGFKKLFGTEPNKVLLIDFLNQILPDRKIKDVSYSSVEKLGLTNTDRSAIFDLYCIGDNGERFIVEMQKAEQNYFKDRSVFYASFPIQEQAQKNEWNFKLEPVYTIGILDFIFDDHKDEKELVHIVELKNQKNEVFYNKLKFIYIELPKFKKNEEELETHFDKWLYVFRHLWQLNERPKKLQDRVFTKLFEVAEIAKFNTNERKAYEHSLKRYRDIHNVIDTAEKKGKKKYLKEGIKKGVKKGIKKTAKKMKSEGFTNEQIKKITGLDDNEINHL